MPARTLPTISQRDIAESNTATKCYVTMGTKVYDVTDFLDSHPGGGDLILEWGGKDITQILEDEVSHTHSEAAYEILDDALVGFVATGKVIDTAAKSTNPSSTVPPSANAEGVAKLKANGATEETDMVNDYKTHKFLDLNKPLLLQVWFGGFSKDFYLEQVHRPRHYKGGESAPLFGNFLEPLSKTPWYAIPIIWLPCIAYGTYLASLGTRDFTQLGSYWFLGLALWTLVEYLLHRFIFHLDG